MTKHQPRPSRTGAIPTSTQTAAGSRRKPPAERASRGADGDSSRPRKDPRSELRTELEAAKNRELRCHAELENYRKRAAREMDERLRYANLGLLRDLMPVMDNVERAIQRPSKNADAAALLEGFKMVEPATRRRASAASLPPHRSPAHALRSKSSPCHHAAAFRGASGQHRPDGGAKGLPVARSCGSSGPGDRLTPK